MLHESRIKPQPCYCCGQPLTFVRKPAAGEGAATEGSTDAVIESWECTNQACITWRQKNPKIPTPPQSK